jgi:hypothetical protein
VIGDAQVRIVAVIRRIEASDAATLSRSADDELL